VYNEVIQEQHTPDAGFVRISGNHLLNSKDDAYKNFVKTELIQAINQCLKDGFAPGDITILTRTHKQGTKCAHILREHEIKFTTAESALLINSATVRIVMGYFEFQLFPQHRFAAFDVVQSLATLHEHVSLADFITEQLNFKEYRQVDLNGFLSKTFGDLSSVMIGENVFHQAISLLRILNIPIDNSLEYLLELIKQHCIGKNHDLHRFIEFWKENKHKLSASAAKNPDAVQIMTVHKSKGLEFPVVIFPHFAEKSKSSQLWINVPEELCELPAAYITVDSNSSQDNHDEDEETDDLTEEIALEKKRRYLDEINTLYVSCTRAVMRLYFIQEKGMSAFNKLLDQSLSELFPEYKTNAVTEIGRMEKYVSELSKATPLHVPSLQGKEILFPRLRLRSVRERDTPEILYGKLLHECFSQLHHKEEIEHVVDRILQGRTDASEYKPRLIADIQNTLCHSTASAWYSEQATTLCEREIVTADGTALRPDRVIVHSDRVVVVDYKTGKESPKHSEQVSNYKIQLQKMYGLPVEGFLLYTEGPKIVPV
jgi:ATP-dependent exoDNAse (exonuclease V) beta subunit